MIITITTTIMATIIIMIILVTCKAAGLSAITSAACLRALLALCSPSAAITWTPAEIIIVIEIVMNTKITRMITWKPGEIMIATIMIIARV